MDPELRAVFVSIFPQICIGASDRSLYGKTISFLWLVVIMLGAKYDNIRCFGGKVTSSCSDYGTEKDIVDAPEYLCQFLKYLRGAIAAPRDGIRLPLPARSAVAWVGACV